MSNGLFISEVKLLNIRKQIKKIKLCMMMIILNN